MSAPGYGTGHPDVEALLDSLTPVDVSPVTWEQPGIRFVADGPDITPGGRVETGEAYEEAACREVYEETGRSIDPGALTYLGFVHYRHRDPMPAGWTRPYPDFLQVMYTAALARSDSLDEGATGWADLDDNGWVLGHGLATSGDVERLPITGAERVFLVASRTAFEEPGRTTSRRRRHA